VARLYGFFKWLSGFFVAVVVAGPLGNWFYDLYKDPTTVPGKFIVDFLQTYWKLELAAAGLIGMLTLWAGLAHQRQQRQAELERQRHDQAYLQRTAIPTQQTTVTITNSGSDRDTIATTGSVHTGDHIEIGQGDYVKGDKITYQAPISAPRSLHQLPSPPQDFTGRRAERDRLLAALDKGVIISGLQGMGGVGKTTLALKLAEHLTARYLDAQFYLDLKGTSPQPLSVTEALAHVIRGYHPTAKLPESEAELQGLYQSVLHDQRALLLMDNAASREQVEPLLPPASCLFLVTSRQHFTLPGMVAEHLDVLPPVEAQRLLLTIAPRIGEQDTAIAQLCGYLPVALRVAASAVAERRDLSPTDYVQRLADTRQRLKHLTAVEASFNVSFALLSPELQQWWCTLAVFPDTFDSKAAAAVWDLPLDHTHDTLSLLLTHSLVEWTSETGRYHLHDLVRLFADAHLEEKTRILGQCRHSTFYQKLAVTADDLYVRGGDTIAQGLALFDMEWGNIQAGQAWAVSQGMNDNVAASLCIGYALMAANLLSLRQHPLQSIQWLEAALAAAQRLQHRLAESNALSRMGNVFLTLGEPRRAIALQEQALAIVRDLGNRRGEAGVLSNLGLVYTALNEPRRAIELHNRQLALAREIGDRKIEAITLGNLGDAYTVLGERNRAIEFYKQALQIHEERGDQHGKAAALVNMGLAYKDLGKTRLAIRCYESGLEIFRELGDRSSEGAALNNLGETYLKLHKPRRALEYCEESLNIARVLGDRQAESDALINLGVASVKLRDPNRALEFYHQALALNRKIENRHGEALTLFGMSLALAKLGERSQAIARAESALVIFESLGDSYARAVRRQLTLWRLIQRFWFWN
jgi:tetratricopeptide (TPR) repeat protein